MDRGNVCITLYRPLQGVLLILSLLFFIYYKRFINRFEGIFCDLKRVHRNIIHGEESLACQPGSRGNSLLLPGWALCVEFIHVKDVLRWNFKVPHRKKKTERNGEPSIKQVRSKFN